MLKNCILRCETLGTKYKNSPMHSMLQYLLHPSLPIYYIIYCFSVIQELLQSRINYFHHSYSHSVQKIFLHTKNTFPLLDFSFYSPLNAPPNPLVLPTVCSSLGDEYADNSDSCCFLGSFCALIGITPHRVSHRVAKYGLF